MIGSLEKMPAPGKAPLLANGVIAYSQCWEDPQTGLRALKIEAGDDVLAITSGGCNVLAFSLEQPKSVIAIDVNPAQNYLLELKMAAIKGMEHPEFLEFLGVRRSNERRYFYGQIRAYLSPTAQAYWDQRQIDIKNGVIHAGRFERYFWLFRKFILPLMHTHRRIGQFLSIGDIEAQQRFYHEHWDNRRWRMLFRVFFGKTVMRLIGGRYPGFLRYAAATDLGGHYLDRARHAFTEIPAADNYFLEYILTGGFIRLEAMPPYLMEGNFEALKRSVERIRVETVGLEVFLSTLPASSISKFYLSDVFERMGPDEIAGIFRELVRVARPGARLCYYNNLVSRRHPAAFDQVITTYPELGQALHRADRSFFYSNVVVGEVVK